MHNFISKKQFKKEFIHREKREVFSGGFTLIETLVAILLLSMSLGALLTLVAGSFYSVRYSRNQIVANNLLQEGIEYMRNTRDTAFNNQNSFSDWKNSLKVTESGTSSPNSDTAGCFNSAGCFVDVYTTSSQIQQCSSQGCPFLSYFLDSRFYGYDGSTYPFPVNQNNKFLTSFQRSIFVQSIDEDQVTVRVEVKWRNGLNTKTLSQTVVLANWQP